VADLAVLIVDDSVVYRSQLREALNGIESVRVVGAVADGLSAIERLKAGGHDLVILDMEMPGLDGLGVLRQLESLGLRDFKVLLFSSLTKRGAEITIEALRLGAWDFVAKPGPSESIGEGTPAQRIRHLLRPKIDTLISARRESGAMPAAPQADQSAKSEALAKPAQSSSLTAVPNKKALEWNRAPSAILARRLLPQVILIGSSTGGPRTLEQMFAELKPSMQLPILIVQHMPPVFTAAFAARLGRITGRPAYEAQHNQAIENGCIYVAPGDYHMRVNREGPRFVLQLDQGPAEHSVRPAVDPLFRSAVEHYGGAVLAAVLTGMGGDGQFGAIDVKKAGGAVLIQSQDSCVVFGMPGAVKATGAYDLELDPSSIMMKFNQFAVGVERLRMSN
jgi:two-component system chemotaxis response regulator CheB